MPQKLIAALTCINVYTGQKVAMIRADKGGEYASREMEEILHEHAPYLELRCPDAPQQNEIAERLHPKMLEMTLVVFTFSELEYELWPECALATIHTKNCTIHKPNEFISPYQPRFGRNASTSVLRA